MYSGLTEVNTKLVLHTETQETFSLLEAKVQIRWRQQNCKDKGH